MTESVKHLIPATHASQSNETITVPLLDFFMVHSGVASVTVHDKSNMLRYGSSRQNFEHKILNFAGKRVL